MTRIPPVKTWQVTYWSNGQIQAQLRVRTVNARFARWLANYNARHAIFLNPIDKITAHREP